MLIGLCGYARVGKNTVADILVRDHGFTAVALADGVRELALRINPTVAAAWAEDDMPLEWLVDRYGWEGVKDTEYGPEVRRLLQEIGTGCRDLLGEDVWIDALAPKLRGPARVVVTDVRFANEADYLQSHWRDGKIWRVERPGVGPANGHASEALTGINADRRILNTGSIDDLARTIGLTLP